MTTIEYLLGLPLFLRINTSVFDTTDNQDKTESLQAKKLCKETIESRFPFCSNQNTKNFQIFKIFTRSWASYLPRTKVFLQDSVCNSLHSTPLEFPCLSLCSTKGSYKLLKFICSGLHSTLPKFYSRIY